MSLEKWHKLGSDLMELLRLETYPVAVKLLRPGEEFPERTRRPLKVLGVKINLCQAFTMTRRYGWTVGVLKDECACNFARFIFGWATLENEEDLVDFLMEAGFFKSKEAAANGAKFTLENCRLKPGECIGIVTSPLTWTRVEPDVVLIYGNPTQAFILVHGHLYHVGGAIEIKYTGRHASCGHGVIQTYLSQRFNVVLPDEGDKMFAATEDYEVIVAVPPKMLAEILEGIRELYEKRVMRYPTPFYMRFQPEFPEPFKKFGSKLKDVE